MTLSGDISTTSTSLNAIKQAIIAKGVTPSGNITTYATAIGNIQTGFPGWTTLSSISVDCSISQILDYNYESDAEFFQQNVASIIPADSMYISTTTVNSNNDTSGIAVVIINDVTYCMGNVLNGDIYISRANDINPEFQYLPTNYDITFPDDINTTIANGEVTITGCVLGVYDASYGSYQEAALIDLTFHFNI